MINYKLFQDSVKVYGAHFVKSDFRSAGLFLPTYRDLTLTESVGPELKRSDADFLSTSKHMFAGDTNCDNLQVDADLSPLIAYSSVQSNVGYTFDQGTSEYILARQTGIKGVLSVFGQCYYSSKGNVAYVPVQSDFGSRVVESTLNTGYTYVDNRNIVYSWVPFGKHFAIIRTTYTVTTYLPKYPQLSAASVRVAYFYTDISSTGTVTLHEALEKTVLSASGSTSAIAAIVAFATLRTSDPTDWAHVELNKVTPKDGSPPAFSLRDLVTYDPRAATEFFRIQARTRLSNAALVAASNSLLQAPRYDEWADLADTAIDSCKFVDINSIAYARDLRQFGSELKSVLQLMKNPANPKKWASLYLGIRYGSRLTVSDTNELVKGIKRCSAEAGKQWNKKFLVTRSRKTTPLAGLLVATTSSRSLNYKVYYKPNDSWIMKGLKTLTDWDIFPTTQNLWDLVPFSFVADWVVNIQKVCEDLDRRAYEQYISILGCTYSYKDEYHIPVRLGDLGFEDADVVVTVYHRHHTPTIHQSTLRLVAGHLSSINVIDGFSLLLQKNKKR